MLSRGCLKYRCEVVVLHDRSAEPCVTAWRYFGLSLFLAPAAAEGAEFGMECAHRQWECEHNFGIRNHSVKFSIPMRIERYSTRDVMRGSFKVDRDTGRDDLNSFSGIKRKLTSVIHRPELVCYSGGSQKPSSRCTHSLRRDGQMERC